MSHRRLALLLTFTFGLPLASACARAQATAGRNVPPLQMPAPPPRDVEPTDLAGVPASAAPAEEPARRAPSGGGRGRANQPAAPAQATRPEPPKVEVPAQEPPKVAEEPAKPPATLQTTPAGTETQLENAIRVELARATSDLNRIDYRALNADARTQYNTAKRFISQAQTALREKNLVFAKNLADKAAALAGQLGGK